MYLHYQTKHETEHYYQCGQCTESYITWNELASHCEMHNEERLKKDAEVKVMSSNETNGFGNVNHSMES